jgi:hypothetical protein
MGPGIILDWTILKFHWGKPSVVPLGILVVTAAAALAPCYATDKDAASALEANAENRKTVKIQLKVGDKTFTATLEDNATAKAFKTKLPATLQMTELNGDEKYFRFPVDLPTNPSNPGTIRAGDLMIYGEYTLVIFYETFPTSYSYTRLGRINDPVGLAAALGRGNVAVTYQLQPGADGNK